MCGILGVHGASETLELNLDILKHRGPDGTQSTATGMSTLGHTRLAIVDLVDGDQPISSPDGRYWLICNGEIYNHQAIRANLGDYDYQTNSDSEVILALYDRYGVEAVTYLDGMFAFAVVDSKTDTLYMGRDPIGIKPLYYGWQDGAFYFSSEIKAMQYHCDDIQEFPPGHYYTHEGGFTQYYDLQRISNAARQQSAVRPPTLEEIRATLERAVHKRLMSDVPVGVYLSGGLDSTIVATLVAQELPNVHSFAVGVEGSEDIRNARIAAQEIGTQHHEYIYDMEELQEALSEVIYYLESFDPLLVRSAIPNYFLARLTRRYVTVVLTGEGADELYAGYHYLKRFEGRRLHDELVQLTGTLYNCNLQRCDRMTMAHSVEGRVPFLDTEFIELSMRVPLDQKIKPDNEIEKWALRKAFENIVPKNVAWRVKEKFSKGAGSSTMLEELADRHISDAEFEFERATIFGEAGLDITTKEMLLCYREFDNLFNDSAKKLVSLWPGEDVA